MENRRDTRYPRFQASAPILMRSALFWDTTQRLVVILYGRFRTTYQSHLQGPRSTVPTFRVKPIGPIFKGQEVFLSLGDRTDRLSRNVGKGLPLDGA
jgi:hypothetical protein